MEGVLPSFTCEVKCVAVALDIAGRRRAHSMALAMRGIAELFRFVKCEKELHREILTISVSHDHRTVRIHGHYPENDGDQMTFYRRSIGRQGEVDSMYVHEEHLRYMDANSLQENLLNC